MTEIFFFPALKEIAPTKYWITLLWDLDAVMSEATLNVK